MNDDGGASDGLLHIGDQRMMDTTTAFVRPSAEGHVEVVVNFGLVSGREATLAEVDRLARRLVGVAGHVQADALRRHDMGPDTEAIVHQVVVRVAAPSSIAEQVRSICETWASECAAERSIEPLAT